MNNRGCMPHCTITRILSYPRVRPAPLPTLPRMRGRVGEGARGRNRRRDLTSKMNSPRTFLDELYRIAVAAAHPACCLIHRLPDPPPSGRVILLAAGKAAGSMTEIAERHYLDDLGLPPSRLAGAAVTRRGYARPTRIIRVTEAGHPVPDDASLAAAERALGLAADATADDLVLVLLSGGASANWIAPAAGLTLAEKQAMNRALLKSGAGIGDINTVRKHLSRIKGGRLARCAHPAAVATLGIS